MTIRSVCVFCGSRPGDRPEYIAAASLLGKTLAERGLTLVYGGAKVGVMGAVAKAALDAGGKVTGIIPKSLVSKEVAHDELTELFVTDSMHARKDRMIEMSDAFVALPGGFGTYDEFFETLTLAQIGLHDKPNALLDVNGFFQPLLALLRHTIAEGFASPENEALVLVEKEPAKLVDALFAWQAPAPVCKWK